MNFTPANNGSLLGFWAVLVTVVCAFFWGVFKTSPSDKSKSTPAKVFLGLALWLGALSCVIESGYLSSQLMPRMPLFLAAINLSGVLLACSPLGKQLANGLSFRSLVAFQTFRLPLELVLHSWASQGTIPETMTWTGQNFDILSGIAALVTFPLVNRWRVLAWLTNAIGFGLLLNVIRVAILSSPLPFAWRVQPPLLLIFYFPYYLIVPICVCGALTGHIILTRALIKK